MTEQTSQNNYRTEIIKDDFGLLPWDYEPNFFARLLGCAPFSIDNEKLIIKENNTEVKLAYDEIESISCEDNKIHIKTSSNHDYDLKARNIASNVSNLILRLSQELNEYKSIMKVDKVVPELGFAYSQKAFSYRGNPYVRAVEILLKTAIDNEFSDIHFEPTNNKVKMSYRLKGNLKYSLELTKDNYEHFIARVKYLAGCNSQISDKAQEGAFRFNNTDIRLSIFPTDFGERASFRIIGAIKFSTIKSLGWNEKDIDKWLKLLESGNGLYLITGAVGTGKTTAMYATLSELVSKSNSQSRAVTIEDPVEAFIEGICQSSFNSKTEKDLATAFKHLLRQDPDIIALGEIRDTDSVIEALQAGLSGHLVFATFHAGSPDEAIDRIKMMASGHEAILAGLKGILHIDSLKYDNGRVLQSLLIKSRKELLEFDSKTN